MIAFDAIHTTEDASAGAIQPRLFGHRLTDLSATAGGTVWIAFVAGTLVGPIPFTVVELFVALVLLTFAPLGLDLAATRTPIDGTGDATDRIAPGTTCRLSRAGGRVRPASR